MDLSLNLRALVSQRLVPRQDNKGRYAAVEIMLNSPLISDLIFKGDVAEIKEIMKKSTNIGMQTFDQALFNAFEENLISLEDALRNADSLNDLRLQIKLNSQPRQNAGSGCGNRAPHDRLATPAPSFARHPPGGNACGLAKPVPPQYGSDARAPGARLSRCATSRSLCFSRCPSANWLKIASMNTIAERSYEPIKPQRVAFIGLGVMGFPWRDTWREPVTP